MIKMNYVEEIRELLSKKIKVNNNLLNLYSLLVLTKGENVTLEDVHDAWSLDRNRAFPKHKSLIPFKELSYEVQQIDFPYAKASREVAREIKRKN